MNEGAEDNQGEGGLLKLAKQLGNVARACRIMGYRRDSFYRFKDLYETGGDAALQKISRASQSSRIGWRRTWMVTPRSLTHHRGKHL